MIERGVILAAGSTLEVPPLPRTSTPDTAAPHVDDLAAVNKAHILGVLEATRGIVAGPDGAAARLGMKRSTLNYRMKKLGISREPAAVRHHSVVSSEPTAEPQGQRGCHV